MPKKRPQPEGKCDYSEKPKPAIKSLSFNYKILLSLESLQGIPCFHCGASIEDIARCIKRNHEVDGDVASQTATGLCHFLKNGNVQKIYDKYMLIGAAAKVQLAAPRSLSRNKEIDRVTEIFPNCWLKDERKHPIKNVNKGRIQKKEKCSSRRKPKSKPKLKRKPSETKSCLILAGLKELRSTKKPKKRKRASSKGKSSRSPTKSCGSIVSAKRRRTHLCRCY